MTPISYSINDAALVSGLGRTTIYELIKRKELVPFKVGSRTLIRHSDLQALVDGYVKAALEA